MHCAPVCRLRIQVRGATRLLEIVYHCFNKNIIDCAARKVDRNCKCNTYCVILYKFVILLFSKEGKLLLFFIGCYKS